MKTQEFVKVARKLVNTGLIRVVRKGEHGLLFFGGIGETDAQNERLWRKCGTLENQIIFKTANEANQVLKAHGITEFTAKPTKSGTMCRLITN